MLSATISTSTSRPAATLLPTDPTTASAPVATAAAGASAAPGAPGAGATTQGCGQWIQNNHNRVINWISETLHIGALKTMAVNPTDGSVATAAKIAVSVLAFFYVGVTIFFGIYELGKKVATWLCGATNPAPSGATNPAPTGGAGGTPGTTTGTTGSAGTTGEAGATNTGSSSSIEETPEAFFSDVFSEQTAREQLHVHQHSDHGPVSDATTVYQTHIRNLERQLEKAFDEFGQASRANETLVRSLNTQLQSLETQLTDVKQHNESLRQSNKLLRTENISLLDQMNSPQETVVTVTTEPKQLDPTEHKEKTPTRKI